MKYLVVIGTLLFVTLLAAAGVLWFFGAPQTQTVAPPTETTPALAQGSEGAAPSATDGDSDVSVTSTVAPPPDPNTPLAIEIPGCVCHSDDPAVVEEHSRYRMNQCMGCHAGQVPTGE